MRTAVIFIALTIIGLLDYYALSVHNCWYLTACGILAFPFFISFFLVSALKSVGVITGKIPDAIGAAFFSVLIALIVFEGILRLLKMNPTYLETIGQSAYLSLYDPGMKNAFWHVYEPNDTTHVSRGDFFYSRRFNSMGLAEREVNLKDTGTKKILCLGDSFTEGVGTVADSTWPRELERALNTCSRDSYLVYNAGVSGCDPVYNYHLLRGKLWDVNWKAVIFCVNGTDLPEVLIRGGMERFKPGNKVAYANPRVWEPLYGSLYIVRYLVLDILKYDWTLHPVSESKQLNITSAQKIRDVLINAQSELNQRGVEMLVVIHPLSYDATKGVYNGYMDTLKSKLVIVKPLDMLPYFLDSAGLTKNNYTDYYWPNDGHFKTLGYRVMGHKVYTELAGRMKIECNKNH